MVKVIKKIRTKDDNFIELKSSESFISECSVLIVGVVHGDEPQGFHIINEFLNTQNCPSNLLFIPCLNPDGMNKNIRTNSNGVDINRNFPTKNWGQNKGENATCDEIGSNYYGGNAPASEIETKFLIDVIEQYHPKLVITLHSPYKVVNYDGEALEIANRISKIIGYPVESSIGYPTPGSFGTYCSIEKQIPVITLELDETCPVETLFNPMFEIFNTVGGFLKI